MKAVFYETDRFRWFQDKESYPRVMYERELTPTRILIAECTREWLLALLDMDVETQRDTIGEILSDPFTIYSN